MKKKGQHTQNNSYGIIFILTFFLSLIKPVDYIFSSNSSLNTAAASTLPILTSSLGAASTGDSDSDTLNLAQNYYLDKKYKKALSLALRIYNNNSLYNGEKTKATLIIARVLKQIGNYEKSTKYYTELIDNHSINYTDKIKYKITIVTLLDKTGKIDSALNYQKQILDSFPSNVYNVEIKKLKAKSLLNISALYFKTGELDSSKKYSFIVINNYQDYFDSIQNFILYNNLANIYISKKQYPKAKENLLKFIEYLGKGNAHAKIRENAYWNLALVLYLMKDYRTFEYADKSFDIRDSLNNKEVQEAINRIEQEFNVERERKKGELRPL
jgi:tetratricopeptide (TPR) repeat protein